MIAYGLTASFAPKRLLALASWLSRATVLLFGIAFASVSFGQQAPGTTAAATSVDAQATLFRNVRIFDGNRPELSASSNVLVKGNAIARISAAPIAVDGLADVRIIEGGGRVLMPGLIDAHWHAFAAGTPQLVAMTADASYLHLLAARQAEATLLRGFTTIRDLGGPVFGLKRAIDEGVVVGPRIYPSGAMISQTSGHGDFRFPFELPRKTGGPLSHSEVIGFAAIADSPDEVRMRAREQLRLGASQIKVVASGGVNSPHGPIETVQYTEPEIRAAVEAAESWGTYVAVHAMNPASIRRSMRAGVKVIEHGHLVDEETVMEMAAKRIWWSMQPIMHDPGLLERMSPSSQRRAMQVFAGTENAFRLAKKHNVKIAFGADILFDADAASQQGAYLARLVNWFSPAETLRIATGNNGELMALSGLVNPYPGKLGVVEEGALADLLLVEGNPLENLEVVADPRRNFVVIMKNGAIFKDTVPR